MYTMHTRFCTFRADLCAQSVPINKISASELRGKFIKSVLSVGQYNKDKEALERKKKSKTFLFFPPPFVGKVFATIIFYWSLSLSYLLCCQRGEGGLPSTLKKNPTTFHNHGDADRMYTSCFPKKGRKKQRGERESQKVTSEA